MMDILVHIPAEREDYTWGTKLNPIRGLTHGYWTLPGVPAATSPGDRIWFCNIDRLVVASAVILYPKDSYPDDIISYHPDDDPDELEGKPAVCFDVRSVIGHEFPVPRELPFGFRGLRYVRRSNKHVCAKYTKALELVGAGTAKALFPKNW